MSNGLWSIPITVADKQVHQANGILRLDKPRQELAAFHHAALGSPATSTLLQAIGKGHLHTFPSLTTSLIAKHLPKSIATAMGHQDQESKNIQSTRSLPNPSPLDTDSDIAPTIKPRSHQAGLCHAI
jgi:hypothetical protein